MNSQRVLSRLSPLLRGGGIAASRSNTHSTIAIPPLLSRLGHSRFSSNYPPQYPPNPQQQGEHKTYFQDYLTPSTSSTTSSSSSSSQIPPPSQSPYGYQPAHAHAPPPQHEYNHHQHQQPQQSIPRLIVKYTFRFFIFYMVVAAVAGGTALYYIESHMPINYPETGSEDDVEVTEFAEKLASNLDIIKRIRSETHEDGTKKWAEKGPLQERQWRRDERGEWSLAPAPKNPKFERRGLIGSTLKGTSRIMINWAWYNERDRELFCLVHVGWAVSGWPKIVHGGVLAALLDEALGFTAISAFPAKTGVTANLKVEYKKPTKAEQFIVIRTRLGDYTDRKATVEGEVQDLHGETLVTAKGLFVVPKKYQLKEITQ